MTKIINERLEPFLNKNESEKSKMGKHQSFTINSPIFLKYWLVWIIINNLKDSNSSTYCLFY